MFKVNNKSTRTTSKFEFIPYPFHYHSYILAKKVKKNMKTWQKVSFNYVGICISDQNLIDILFLDLVCDSKEVLISLFKRFFCMMTVKDTKLTIYCLEEPCKRKTWSSSGVWLWCQHHEMIGRALRRRVDRATKIFQLHQVWATEEILIFLAEKFDSNDFLRFYS